MIKESLFDAEEREAKLDKLGDILQVLEKQVDFKGSRRLLIKLRHGRVGQKAAARRFRRKSWSE